MTHQIYVGKIIRFKSAGCTRVAVIIEGIKLEDQLTSEGVQFEIPVEELPKPFQESIVDRNCRLNIVSSYTFKVVVMDDEIYSVELSEMEPHEYPRQRGGIQKHQFETEVDRANARVAELTVLPQQPDQYSLRY